MKNDCATARSSHQAFNKPDTGHHKRGNGPVLRQTLLGCGLPEQQQHGQGNHSDSGQLPEFHAEVESKQGFKKIKRRQAQIFQSIGKTHAVNQAETEKRASNG